MLLTMLLSAAVALAPAADPTPPTTTPAVPIPVTTTDAPPPVVDVCGLLNVQVLDTAKATAGLQVVLPAAVPSQALVSAGRAVAGCSGDPDAPDAAAANARLCVTLNTATLDQLADRFAATTGVRAQITDPNIAAARRALACDTPPTTATTTAPVPASTTRTPASSSGSQVTQIPVGAADTGEGPGEGPGLAAFATVYGLAGLLAGMAAGAAITAAAYRRRA
jgi:hypothetical protein